MKFLKSILRKWVFEDGANQIKLSEPVAVRENSLSSYGFNLRVYKASGGTVIETNTYDSSKDRHRNGLYVITDDKDLGHEISKIITIENLKV